MVETKEKHQDLREACVAEALRIVETSGFEKLSLREVARRLGVSHQAPYRHFPSRDHILAEIVSRAYSAFASHLEKRRQTGDPDEDLCEMGRAYLSYAKKHSLQYQLMFSTPLPDPKKHPNMMAKAQQTFSLLHENVSALHALLQGSAQVRRSEFDALFIWFTLHGLCSLMQSRVADQLALPPKTVNALHDELFKRIEWMLQGKDPDVESPRSNKRKET